MANWYVNGGNGSTTGYWAIPLWAAGTAYQNGSIVRQKTAPAYGNERCFVNATGTTFTSDAATEPKWNLNKGGPTNEVSGRGVWTECTGAESRQGTSGTWAAPMARLQTAHNYRGSGPGEIFVSNTHTETKSTAPFTITVAGSDETQIPFTTCVAMSANIPPLYSDRSTGAVIQATGTVVLGIQGASGAVWEGIRFKGGTAANATYVGMNEGAYPLYQQFINCATELATTDAGSVFSTGREPGIISYVNHSLKFAAVTQGVVLGRSHVNWRGLIIEGTPPTNFLNSSGVGRSGYAVFDCMDLSAITGTIVPKLNYINPIVLSRSKLANGATIKSGSHVYNDDLYLSNCDYTTGYAREEKHGHEGVLTLTDQCIRAGGDPASWKIVTPAGLPLSWYFPLRSRPINKWNAVVGKDLTVAVYGIWASAAVPLNTDIWIEVDYFGDRRSPLGTRITTTVADFGTTGASVASDTSGWSGTVYNGLSNKTRFKLVATLNSPQPQAAGWIRITVCCAKSNSIFYIDRLAVFS